MADWLLRIFSRWPTRDVIPGSPAGRGPESMTTGLWNMDSRGRNDDGGNRAEAAPLRAQHLARGRAGDAPLGIDSVAVDDRVFDAARRHDHALGASRQGEAPLAAARGSYLSGVEDRDVGGVAAREPAAPLDAEQIGRLRRQPCYRLFQ